LFNPIDFWDFVFEAYASGTAGGAGVSIFVEFTDGVAAVANFRHRTCSAHDVTQTGCESSNDFPAGKRFHVGRAHEKRDDDERHHDVEAGEAADGRHVSI
jgi:hypothetical protein